MHDPIRIIMADDHELFRDGFAGMFINHPAIQLVDQASNGAFLVSLVDRHKPDVVVTDIQMNPMDGFKATEIIKKRHPDIPVIAMSSFDDNGSIISMLKAGAIGYVVKNAPKQVIADAIIAAHKGENYYCRTTSEKLSALISAKKLDPISMEMIDFTPLELRIINLICQDKESKEIAEAVHVHLSTVNKYRVDIMEKAGVKSAGALIVWAVRNGVYRP